MAEISQTSAPAEASSQANSAPKEKGNPVYEVGFHVVPTVGDEGVGVVVESVRKILGDLPDGKAGAEIISESFPRKISLAYQVERATQGKREKYTESYFGYIKFATTRDALPAIHTALGALNPILRFLIVETVREDIAAAPRRAVFTSDRLEGKTIEKPATEAEKPTEVSDAELDKSIEALTGQV